MDKVVQVTRSFLNRVRGFCNIFASACNGCLRRSPMHCPDCIEVIRARELIREIDTLRDAREERYFVEHPNEEIAARILKALDQARRPVHSREIRLDGVSKFRKNRVLNQMVRRRLIEKVDCGHGIYRYARSASRN